MKNIYISLAATALLLVGCSSPESSSSLSSQGSSESSSSTSSSTSSSSEPVLGSLLKQVGDGAYKYNGGKSYAELATAAKLGIDAESTEGNLVLLLKAAFKDYMPKMTGQRKYGGVYTLPDKYEVDNNNVKIALSWMVSYGLWGNETFIESQQISQEDVDTVLKRFYFYFGTEKKDDFFATLNHDFLFEATDDQTKTVNDEYRDVNLLSDKKTKENVIAMAKGLANSSDSSEFYKLALGFQDGTLDYSFSLDSDAQAEITKIKSISSFADYSSYCVDSLKEYGESDIMRISGPGSYKGDDGKAKVALDVVCGPKQPFASTDYDEAATKAEVKENYLGMGLSETEADAYSTSYASLQSKAHEYYIGDTYTGYPSNINFLYDTATSKDIYDGTDIGIDLQSIMTDGGYTLNEMSYLRSTDTTSYLSYSKAVEGAEAKELAAASLLEFYFNNNYSIEYRNGTENAYSSFLYFVGDNIAADYMKTEAWTNSTKVLVDTFDGLRTAFGERIASSSWLSEQSKSVAKTKLDAMGYILAGQESSGTTLDYASRSVPNGLNLRASLAKKSSLVYRNWTATVASGASMDKVSAYIDSPFLSNAFYMLFTNNFVITFASIFSLGYDLSKLDEETVYGRVAITIGHEMSHGFDNMGVYFDKDGTVVMDTIFTKEDSEKFTSLISKVTELYKGAELLPGMAQNSKNTVGECTADISGLALTEALAAKDALFDYEKFYEELACGFGDKITRGYYKNNYYENVHPYGRVRLNTLVSNSDKFESTYELKEGDGMYIAPSKRVSIW